MYSKEDQLYKTILIIGALLGIIILAFVAFVIVQQRRFRKMSLHKMLVETETLENERKKLAADLHDEIGPLMTLVKMNLESIDPHATTGKLLVDQSISLVQDMITRVRWMSNVMMPSSLLQKGLLFATIEFINRVSPDSGLRITFKNNYLPQLNPATEIHIFRILQEIIHNTIKHARAGALNIELTASPGSLLILTADNGTGFDAKTELKAGKGLGLQILHNRTALLGGELHVRSFKGEGTCYHIKIPVS